MSRSFWLWTMALLVTLLSARYQRVTGPTHAIDGRATLGAATFPYTLERTHAGAGDHRVAIHPADPATAGVVEWQPLGGETWIQVPMRREGEALVADLPHQPMGGKLRYRVTLKSGAGQIVLPAGEPALIRFRGDVPIGVLLPHILAMFAAMLFSTRAGLEALRAKPQFKALTDWTLGCLFVGGFVLGCLVAWYGFRAPWGGFPVSNDLTDNKTLVAFIGWLVAAIAVRRARHPKAWVVIASVLMLLVYLIPHSMAAPR